MGRVKISWQVPIPTKAQYTRGAPRRPRHLYNPYTNSLLSEEDIWLTSSKSAIGKQSLERVLKVDLTPWDVPIQTAAKYDRCVRENDGRVISTTRQPIQFLAEKMLS